MLRRLYVCLALLALLPIWSASYLPTSDGPSHVYNSWILQQLVKGSHSPAADWYAIDWRPLPNWLGHAVMALLMFVVPALIAEKLLVSGIVLLFLYAIWRYAGAADESRNPERQAFAFLAFPFAYNLLLQQGFYNFCISAALYFLVLAVWWKRRDTPDARTIAIVAGLLLLCYFSHPMSTLLTIGSIGIFWLATLPGRPIAIHARHLVSLLPVLPLLVWFFRVQGASLARAPVRAAGLFSYIMRMWVLLTFDEFQAKLGFAFFLGIAALIIITLIRRRWRWSEGDAFILVTIALIVVYARAPAASSGGTMIMERMALFVVLSPIAWLAPRLPRRATIALVMLLSVVSVAYTGFLAQRYRRLSRRVEELVRSADAIGPGTAFVPLIRDVRPHGSFVAVQMHAIDYAAVEKGSVDIANYEAAAGYFPIRFRAGIAQPETNLAGPKVSEIDLTPYLARVPYVFLWHVPDDAPVMSQLAICCERVGASNGGRVYLKH
ncbi:MAG TPA: hypothetical protein VHX14_17940 [Thermoanaerobaculia bacterium]|jgi:hypothetical protein|nr:hypothetical protein [Thermoanaerobaculia bacterium]